MEGGSAVSVSFLARVTGSREVMRTRLARARSSSAGTSSAVDIFCAPSILANARVLPLFGQIAQPHHPRLKRRLAHASSR